MGHDFGEVSGGPLAMAGQQGDKTERAGAHRKLYNAAVGPVYSCENISGALFTWSL